MVTMQACNLQNLPENYQLKYYLYHALSWPQLLFLAEDQGKVVGYVLAKLDDEDNEDTVHGHITSISVLRSYRKLGLATKLMRASCKIASTVDLSLESQMKAIYEAHFVSLHVRVSNRAAYGLYHDVLGYDVTRTEVGYYADGEDAYEMKLQLQKPKDPEKDKVEDEEKKEAAALEDGKT